MKKLTVYLILLLLPTFCIAQSIKVKEMLESIEGFWKLDNNGNISISKVIKTDSLSMQEIYSRALNYFVYNYGSGKSVIQTQDEELGRIVAKGTFSIDGGLVALSCWHIIRIDTKEGRARVIVTLLHVETTESAPILMTELFPINENAMRKTWTGKVFYKSVVAGYKTISAIDRAINSGNTTDEFEATDW
jgi:hypothetical protein